MKLIDKDKLLEGLKELKQNFSASPIVVMKNVESLVDSLEVKEVDFKDTFTERACDAYCKVCGHYPHGKLTHICRQECDYFKDFQIYIKGK